MIDWRSGHARSALLAALAGFVMALTWASPAEARKRCVYMAHNPFTGSMIVQGTGWAFKKSWACNRARRRCNRRLERKRRRSGVPRGTRCRRITNL